MKKLFGAQMTKHKRDPCHYVLLSFKKLRENRREELSPVYYTY